MEKKKTKTKNAPVEGNGKKGAELGFLDQTVRENEKFGRGWGVKKRGEMYKYGGVEDVFCKT